MTGTTSGGRVLVAGSANVDFVVRAPRIPAPGETVLGGDLAVVPGGKGANQAVACARAGVETVLLAALGDDAFAPIIGDSLRGAGVTLAAVRSGRPTGAALITVSEDAENAITVAPGANATLAPGDLPDLDGVAWLVVQLETPLPTVTAFAQAARAAGVKVLLNVAPARMLPAELIAAVDVLIANEEELAVASGASGSIADQLAAVRVPMVVVTLGARGCAARVDGRAIVQPAFAVTPVDTTAAGDSFCGMLAAELAAGRDPAAALRAAAAAGALATTRAGAQSSIPTRAEVDALLATGETGDPAALARYCGLNS